IKGGKILRKPIMGEDGSADHVVKTLSWQIILEAGYSREFSVGDNLRPLRELVIENRRGNRIFTPQYGGEVFSPQAAAGSKFKDRFTGQNVEGMPDSKSAPAQLEGRSTGMPEPISFPAALHAFQVLLKRHRSRTCLFLHR